MLGSRLGIWSMGLGFGLELVFGMIKLSFLMI
jgi:hypothetical protein